MDSTQAGRSGPRLLHRLLLLGDPARTSALRINGKILEVPSNTAKALWQIALLYRRRIVRLWIDAVCIDQENAEERGHQVGQMSRIYRNGICNFVYLSDEAGLARSAWTNICDIREEIFQRFPEAR
jgi:hypothetical protein